VPTGRGWLVVLTGLALWVAGRTFGARPLEQLGFGLIALVVIAVVVVRSTRHELKVTRALSPQRVPAGREVKVVLTLENIGRGAAPLMLLEDRVPSELSGRARFALSGIEAGGNRETTYKVRPARRGRFLVGPLRVVLTDPFGVARISGESAPPSPLLAYPKIEQLTLPRESGTRRSVTSSARRQPTGTHGEDFYTLREYVEGDDLRRIHWPATAKRNRYMIRQEETPWHASATIVLDDRAGTYERSGWERAVEAAASLCDLYHRAGFRFRLVTAGGHRVPSARGSDHFHRCLDLLTTLEPSTAQGESDPLTARLLELEAQSQGEGALLVVTGDIDGPLAAIINRSSAHFRMATVVSLPPHRYSLKPADPATEQKSFAAMAMLRHSGIRTTVVGPGESFALAWGSIWSPGSGSAGGGESSWDRKPARA
jgi:uncharacterized protein (DUF58 family)